MILETILGVTAFFTLMAIMLCVSTKDKIADLEKQIVVLGIRLEETRFILDSQKQDSHLPTVKTKGSCGDDCGCH